MDDGVLVHVLELGDERFIRRVVDGEMQVVFGVVVGDFGFARGDFVGVAVFHGGGGGGCCGGGAAECGSLMFDFFDDGFEGGLVFEGEGVVG